MEITVRYYAQAREAAGRDEERIVLDAGASLDALWHVLAARHPALSPLEAGVSFAVGANPSARETSLQAGDVVSILPPVSGG